MLALRPVAPQTGWRVLTRLARDHYVRLDSSDYPVRPAVIGRRIEVVAGLDRVQAFRGGQLVAGHERSWAWHQSCTGPAHRSAAVALRRQRVAVLRRPAGPEVQVRALAGYDTALGTGGAWRDGRQDRRARHHRGDRVPHPGAESSRAASPCPGWPTGPARSAGPMRSSWPAACSARSPPGNPAAARAGSAPPGSRPARAWRSPASTTPAACGARSSPTGVEVVIAVPAAVAVGPVQAPVAGVGAVAQLGHAYLGPFGQVRVPRRSAAEDGDRVAADCRFDADLVKKAGWDPGSAVLAYLGDIGLWRCGHPTTLGLYRLAVAPIAAVPATPRWLVES
jgi:hypothetical protein